MPNRRPTVIIADDHPLVAEGLARILAGGYDVVAIVGNGKDLMEQAVRLRPEVICVDVAMPEINGIQAALRIHGALPRTKIVFVTQQIEMSYVRAAFRAGGSAYIAKQSATGELTMAIEKVLAGGTYITHLLSREAAVFQNELTFDATKVYTDPLTDRQREVLKQVAEGKTAKEIALLLNISAKTVEFHKQSIMDELGIRTIAELTRYAVSHGLVTS